MDMGYIDGKSVSLKNIEKKLSKEQIRKVNKKRQKFST
jgi:hypothetical protein